MQLFARPSGHSHLQLRRPGIAVPALTFTVAMVLSQGCGQTGPLYLPGPEAQQPLPGNTATSDAPDPGAELPSSAPEPLD